LTNLIDTDVAIDFLDGAPYALGLFEQLVSESKPLLSVVSYAEIREGVFKHHDPRPREAQLDELMSVMVLCDFDRAIADVAASVRHDLRSRGRNVRRRALDLLIAATAIAHNAKLVTRNIEDYQDITNIVFYPAEFAKQ
jgi:tRNA(fMet)-specific endonuclease VapC